MPRLGLLSGAVALLLTAAPVAAQTTYTWNTTTTDPTWLVPGNWTAGGSAATTFPGLSANSGLANGTATDLAVIGDHAFPYFQTLNIDMGVAGGQLALGAIQYNATGPTTGVLTIGNTSATGGLLRLNGATVNGVPNVLLAATGSWDMRVGNPTMGIVLGTVYGTVLANPGLTVSVLGNISEAVAGSRINVRGGGTVYLGGANTFTGTVLVLQGSTLQVGADSAFGAVPGASRLALSIVLSNGTLLATTGFTLNPNRGIALGPAFGGGTINVSSGQTLTYNGVIADNSGGTGSLTKSGAGTLVLGGANTYSGGTTISGGVLSINLLANSGAASNIGTGNFQLSGGTLRYTGPGVGTNRLFTLAGGAIDASGTGPLAFTASGMIFGGSNPVLTLTGTNTGANTIAPVLGSSINVAKSGTGTWVLTGANTYTGTTTVTAGALLVNGDQFAATGAVAVNSGGTLGGTGRVGGAVTVASGGAIRAGDITAAGKLTLNGGLSMAAGSALSIRINDAVAPAAAGSGGSSNSLSNPTNHNYLLVAAGTSAINPGMTVAVDGTGIPFTLFSTYSYKVAQLTGDQSGVNITDPSHFSFTGFSVQSPSLTGDPSAALYLSFTPVPEPVAVLGIAAAVVGAARLVRRVRCG